MKSSLNKAAQYLVLSTLIWAVCFTVLICLELIPLKQIIISADIFQLFLGLLMGICVLGYFKKSKNPYAVLGTSLAIFSWTMGQLFWFSYTLLTGSELPYPSVGDFGFTGTYFFLIGVIGILKTKRKRSPLDYSAFFILIVPLILLILGQSTIQVHIFNFILTSTVAIALFKALPLRHDQGYRWFVLGLLILAITDLVFMSSIVLFPESSTMSSAPLYPIALSLVAYGIIRHEVATDD